MNADAHGTRCARVDTHGNLGTARFVKCRNTVPQYGLHCYARVEQVMYERRSHGVRLTITA